MWWSDTPIQELFETMPIEAMERFGEELGRQKPELSLFYDVEKERNPILIVSQKLEQWKMEMRICYNASAKRFDITGTHKNGTYTIGTFDESASQANTVLFLIKSAFSFIVEPEGAI